MVGSLGNHGDGTTSRAGIAVVENPMSPLKQSEVKIAFELIRMSLLQAYNVIFEKKLLNEFNFVVSANTVTTKQGTRVPRAKFGPKRQGRKPMSIPLRRHYKL
jgi:hypothetical protein